MSERLHQAGKLGRAFEDFKLGDIIVSDGRTIEASDISTFAGLTGDFFPLHVDEEYAKKTPFGGRIAHGPLTFSISSGLMYQSGYYGMAIQNMLECQNMRALLPVRPGDTLRVRAEVVGLDEWKRPNLGKLTVIYSVLNQKEEEVMTYSMVMLAKRRNPEVSHG
ncbi:acyl dehydratase [Advenella incenata]|uniref:Acyl dehydratase n=1 Tax=Advenella incenata TaxID=267800 RepID=A0A4Q7VFU7_9BURK|nr:MaoC/PaaZ C-terminal domain-containing protein [Advenella incenata]RZT94869.1 acyl dehydratase [Advenella incenata]